MLGRAATLHLSLVLGKHCCSQNLRPAAFFRGKPEPLGNQTRARFRHPQGLAGVCLRNFVQKTEAQGAVWGREF